MAFGIRDHVFNYFLCQPIRALIGKDFIDNFATGMCYCCYIAGNIKPAVCHAFKTVCHLFVQIILRCPGNPLRAFNTISILPPKRFPS